MTSLQIKAARQLLGWSQYRLGLMSGTSAFIVNSFEREGLSPRLRPSRFTQDRRTAIRTALEVAGIKFGEQDTVRLIKVDQ